eukprot:89843-Lingulodinium_polyedra.AAC.1
MLIRSGKAASTDEPNLQHNHQDESHMLALRRQWSGETRPQVSTLEAGERPGMPGAARLMLRQRRKATSSRT